ncbi:hypothetical protein A3715_20170 [Oleiphilus sp. HI0009]|nr:hypothetical protein A3715_20170 [Oleiphilus sp. HI0009]
MDIELKKEGIAVGKTTVTLSGVAWEKHGRTRCEVVILCVDNPYSSYDGIRDVKPSIADVKRAVDWIIEHEDQVGMSGYTDEQIANLKNEIGCLIDRLLVA